MFVVYIWSITSVVENTVVYDEGVWSCGDMHPQCQQCMFVKRVDARVTFPEFPSGNKSGGHCRVNGNDAEVANVSSSLLLSSPTWELLKRGRGGVAPCSCSEPPTADRLEIYNCAVACVRRSNHRCIFAERAGQSTRASHKHKTIPADCYQKSVHNEGKHTRVAFRLTE